MATAPPAPHRHRTGDVDCAGHLNPRVSSSRSSVAEAGRCRRSMASPTDANDRRSSRVSPPVPNCRRGCDPRPSDDNSHFMPGGVYDHPPGCFRVSGGEEYGDGRRRARVSDGEEDGDRRRRARVSDDEREDGMRSVVTVDQRENHHAMLCCRSPSREWGSCPDDRRVESLRPRDDYRRMEDNRGKRRSPLKREPRQIYIPPLNRMPMMQEVKDEASLEYQRQDKPNPEYQRRARVSDGEEDGDRRRRARVSDDERENGHRRMRSVVSDDQRENRRAMLCRRIPRPARGSCPDDRCVESLRRWDDCRHMEDNRGKRRSRPQKREPRQMQEVKDEASLEYQRQDKVSPECQRQDTVSPECQRHSWGTIENCIALLNKVNPEYQRQDKVSPEYQRQDRMSPEYQRHSWDALEKSINGLLSKVNATNIKDILPELFSQNLIRGRGIFCQSCIKSQMISPWSTDVFAALVAVVNTKFPEIGHLLLARLVLCMKRAFKLNDKVQLLAAAKFVAHLVNQVVARELVALELLEVLLVHPTDDSVEVAVGFVKECGAMLQLLSPQRLHDIFERFHHILHKGETGKRVQLLIKGLFETRKSNFKEFPPIHPELDLVEQGSKVTHKISLEDELDPKTNLNFFMANPNFIEDEKAYENIKKSILASEPSGEEPMETRYIRLTVMASAYFEEAGLVKLEVRPGQEMELCATIIECCSEERTYLPYFGLLAQRYCMMRKAYQENFEKCFVQQYSMSHHLNTCKLINIAKFFGHLLETDTLPWHVLACIRLSEEQATSTRIFIRVLFKYLLEHLGIQRLNERLNDPNMQGFFESVFPKDDPRYLSFAISFFMSTGLGDVIEKLKEKMTHLVIGQDHSWSESESSSDSSSDESN